MYEAYGNSETYRKLLDIHWDFGYSENELIASDHDSVSELLLEKGKNISNNLKYCCGKNIFIWTNNNNNKSVLSDVRNMISISCVV